MEVADIREAEYLSLSECIRILKSEKTYSLELKYMIHSNSSDKVFLQALQDQSGTPKLLSKALKGIKLWYIKQCTEQEEADVLRELLQPFMEPIILVSRVGTYIL